MRALGLLLLVSAANLGCVASSVSGMLRPDPAIIAEFPSARVRIYYLEFGRCRVEIVTATDTILTEVARCRTVPNKAVAGGSR